MMAKITKGCNFGGAVRYVTQDEKGAKLLDSKGVLTTDRQSIIDFFRLQSQLRPDLKMMVTGSSYVMKSGVWPKIRLNVTGVMVLMMRWRN